MGQITIRELENMDFFKEIPKDILQNLLNESKVVSYKKKEVIFHSRSRTKTVYFVYSGEVMLYNLTKHGNRKVIFILGKGQLLNQSIVSKKPNALFCEAACPSSEGNRNCRRTIPSAYGAEPCFNKSCSERI